MMPSIKYLPLSGIEDIDGCIHLLQLDDKKIIFDAGIDPKDGLSTLEKIANLEIQAEAIYVSHAHIDHVGALPVLIKKMPQARIYMTYPTAQLAERMLFHHYNLSVRKARENWTRLRLDYTPEELEQMFYLFQSFPYKQEFPIHSFFKENISASFWDAGHILGSAMVSVKYKKIHILYSGNFRLSAQSIMKGASIPRGKVDILFLESTYGNNSDTNDISYSSESKRLTDFINDKLRKGGKVLLPVFALGRTQEMIHLLYQQKLRGNLESAHLFITGLGNSFTKIYDLMRRFWKKKGDSDLRKVVQNLRRIEDIPEKSIILATSGFMREGTYSMQIARKILNDPRSGIGFVGYLEPDSPGYRLREKALNDLKDESRLLKGAEVRTFHFSAHASQVELVKLVEKTNPRVVILYHGDSSARSALSKIIRLKFPDIKVINPKEGEWIDLSSMIT